MTSSPVLGIDIGGSGIKGALVNVETGTLASHRLRIPTPQPANPAEVAEVVSQVVAEFTTGDNKAVAGITFPTIVQHGVTHAAANLGGVWAGVNAEQLFSDACGGMPVRVLNDADAAGYAEITFGAAAGNEGLVLVTTLGTGIGTALFYRGILVPNAELGHLEIDGVDYESRAAARVKDEENLSWAEYIPRLQRYYETLEFLLSPDLFVVGGGISKEHAKFLPALKLRTPIVPAQMRNKAGIIGAACYVASVTQLPGR